jgi:hypothetical protein
MSAAELAFARQLQGVQRMICVKEQVRHSCLCVHADCARSSQVWRRTGPPQAPSRPVSVQVLQERVLEREAVTPQLEALETELSGTRERNIGLEAEKARLEQQIVVVQNQSAKLRKSVSQAQKRVAEALQDQVLQPED